MLHEVKWWSQMAWSCVCHTSLKRIMKTAPPVQSPLRTCPGAKETWRRFLCIDFTPWNCLENKEEQLLAWQVSEMCSTYSSAPILVPLLHGLKDATN